MSKKNSYYDFFLKVRSNINAATGEVNLLLRGKLKQFRDLCQANVVCSRKKYLIFFLIDF